MSGGICYEYTKAGDLRLTVEADQQKELIELGDDIQTDQEMYDWFESMVCNCDIDWIKPEDIGALTSAPILGITSQDDDGNITEVHDVWWYPNYAVRSPLEDLRDYGECIFTKAEEVK